MQEENIDLRSQIKSQQSQLDHSKKSTDQQEKLKQKLEREKYANEESFKQLKGITDEIVQLAQREGNSRVKEQVHLILQRIKRLDDGVKKTQDSSSVISYSTSKSKVTKSRGPSKEQKSSKESSVSRTNNFSASKTKSSVTSSSANKFYKQASPRSNKNGLSNASVVTVVSNKKMKSQSKSRNPSQKILHLEDLDESIESRRSAMNKQNSNNPVQKKITRKNSLVFSQNNSLDFDTMSPHTSRKQNNIMQTNRSTSRQRSVSKNSDYSAPSKSKSQSKRKQNYSQISQNSIIYNEERPTRHHHNHHEEDDIDNLITNHSQITVKPSHSTQSNALRYGNSQGQHSQSQNVITEPRNPTAYIQSFQFPENFEKMAESEISNEIFKLERAVAETKREYNNLLAKSREKGDFNIEEMRSRMNELAIDMQKHSDWQFVLKKRQREIITMSFGKSNLQTNFIN